jgi:hypothetical protein
MHSSMLEKILKYALKMFNVQKNYYEFQKKVHLMLLIN